MIRKVMIPVLVSGLVALLAGGFLFTRPQIVAKASQPLAGDQAESNAPATVGTYVWSFSAKFVCGFQAVPIPLPAGSALGEPVVMPGNYATEINIQNPNFNPLPFALTKRVLVLVEGDAVRSEPVLTPPTGGAAIEMAADNATLDDCNTLWVLTHPQTSAFPSPMPLFIGYLVILSPLDLNVNAVYTANASGVAAQIPSSTAIDVLTVTGKRVFIPSGTTP